MVTIRQGGKVYGPGVFMFEGEAAQVKAALLAYGTKAAKRLADEIGMPSDGVAYPHGGEIRSGRKSVDALLDELLCMGGYQSYIGDTLAGWAKRLADALKVERALRTTINA